MLPTKQMEEDDPDLAAAIRASLADAPPAPTTSISQQPYQYNGYQASAPYVPQAPIQASVPSYELAMSEFDALDSFSNAIPARQVSIDDANELFYRADRHRGKMIRSLEDSQVKAEMLDELNRKLQRAVRLYDSLLERRVASYNQPYQPYQPYQPQHQHYQQQYAEQQPQQYASMPQQQHTQQYASSVQHHQQPFAMLTGASPQPAMYAPAQQPHAMPQLQRQASVPHQVAHPHAPELHRQASLAQSHRSSQQYQQPVHDERHQQTPQYPQQYASHSEPAYHQQQAQQRSDAQQIAQPTRQPYYGPPEQQPYVSPSTQASALPPMSPPMGTHGLPQDFNYPSSPQRSNGASLPAENAPSSLSYEPAALAAAATMQSPRLESGLLQNGYAHDPPQQPALQISGPLQQGHAPQGNLSDTNAMYDAAGNKLRLQGYYSANSFPAVPQVPVGGLPIAPNGALTTHDYDQKERHHEQEVQQKEEAALIEF